MIMKIIVLCLLLKLCVPGFSVSGCAVRLVRWGLRLCTGLFLLWLLLHTIG